MKSMMLRGRSICCNNWLFFSEFKNKFQCIQSKSYSSPCELYEDLERFQKNLSWKQMGKYKKSLPQLDRKLKKLIEERGEKVRQFNTSLTFQYFYQYQNGHIKPTVVDPHLIKRLPIQELHHQVASQILTHEHKNIDLFHSQLVNNPEQNQQLLQHIKARFKYYQEHLCLNVFESYDQLFRKNQQYSNTNKNSALQKLLSDAPSAKSAIKYKGDFKFKIKNSLSSTQIFLAIKVSKYLVLNNIYTEKTLIFIQQCILDDHTLKKISPQVLGQVFFVLAHMSSPLPKLNDKLFDIFEIFIKIPNQQKLFEVIFPLLFYMRANKIENYSVFKNCLHQFATILSNNEEIIKEKTLYEKEIILLLIQSAKQKFCNMSQITNIPVQKLLSDIKRIQTSSHRDFQRFLNKFSYTFIKNGSNMINLQCHIDPTYRIENKNFICINNSKLCPYRGEHILNGMGQILVDFYRENNEAVKIINSRWTHKMQKWGEKEEYFKTKMKGITKPNLVRNRQFGL